MKFKTFPVFLAFLAMGFIDAVGPFVGLAKNEFTLSNTVAFMIPFAGFLMFGLISVPMGVYQAKKGKKFILMLGLVVMLIGLIIPIFGLKSFSLFLVTILLLGIGGTIMQVAGNPIMRDVSEDGKFARNLSLAQFIKAIGSLSGPVIPTVAAAMFGADWSVIFIVYSISLVVTILFVSTLKVEEKVSVESNPVTLGSCLALLKNGYVVMMVGAIFLYVGAEVCMSSGLPIYLESEFGINLKEFGLLGTGVFFTTLVIGRFMGGIILNWLSPQKFFLITVIVSFLAMLGLFTAIPWIVIVSVILVGVGYANIFPLVFSITVDSMPEKSNELSGLMITAIVGGAFIPPLMGLLSDSGTIMLGFIVPLLAIVYIGWTAIMNFKKV